ncbi:MAG TPA: class I SAM-dependent methyltransferase [Bryobacteraceae bacterium]|nr:class I SAM-dependent methyltransferase [Bryobacteraceae bacterium]
MSATQDQIAHVSDTALMVAACRAMETAIPEGIIHDPFAEQLAGERGMAIARAFPDLDTMRFGIGVRSRFVDELVMYAIAELRLKTVLIIGCGLDSRPWRLDLPADLRWIEVDFPAMLEYKAAVLESATPKCRLERMSADLTDSAQRLQVFAAVGDSPSLMITEGLLMYLPAKTVEAIATESHSTSGIRHWMLDVTSPELDVRMGINSRQAIQNVRAEGHLNGVEIMEVQRRAGWTPVRHRSYIRNSMEVAAARIQAMIASGGTLPNREMAPPPPDDPSGVYLMGR